MCPSGTRLGPEHDLRYVFVLDIFCQQLWGFVQLGGVCVPFGHKVGACTCSEICFLYWIYSANNCGVFFSWGVSVCPSGTRLGPVHVLIYVFGYT